MNDRWMGPTALPALLLVAIAGCIVVDDSNSGCVCLPEGAACSDSLDCEGALLCTNGRCTASTTTCASAGSACVNSNQCCGSAICISDTGRCHDSCSSGEDCHSGCCVSTQQGSFVCAASSNCN